MSATGRALCIPMLALVGVALTVPLLAAQPPRLIVKLRASPTQVALDTVALAREQVPATPAETFAALRAVYEELKIPRTVDDSAHGQLGTLRLVRTSSLAGERMAAYLNCGSGMTGAYADSWRITMGIASFVRTARDGSTTVATGFVAQADDMDGASKEPIMCGSTGVLETRIASMVKERIATGR